MKHWRAVDLNLWSKPKGQGVGPPAHAQVRCQVKPPPLQAFLLIVKKVMGWLKAVAALKSRLPC